MIYDCSSLSAHPLRAWIAALLLGINGCCSSAPDLPPTAKVSGVVKIDGRPLSTGMVQFIPETTSTAVIPATSKIGPDGSYDLSTAGVRGALVGQHAIRVTAMDESQPGAPWLIPIRYNRPEESGLKAEVVAGQNNVIDLELTSP